LGDSITVGVGAPPGKGYVNLIASQLAGIYSPLYVRTFSKDGIRSKELYFGILALPHVRQMVRQSKLITLYIGGNDLSLAYLKYRLFGNISVINGAINSFSYYFHQMLQWLRNNSEAIIVTFNLYNPFPNEPLACHFIPVLNEQIAQISDAFDLPVVDVFHAFEGRQQKLIYGYRTGKLASHIPLLQRNPIHPNTKGHRVIAESFWM
jgi:lysophospholipase L1-like esterase